jgi:hypothetical protein
MTKSSTKRLCEWPLLPRLYEKRLQELASVCCPALPVSRRTVYLVTNLHVVMFAAKAQACPSAAFMNSAAAAVPYCQRAALAGLQLRPPKRSGRSLVLQAGRQSVILCRQL